MSPLDFEKKIAKELQEREMQPSTESWARLQARLDHEKKEGIFKLWWIGAAAAVVVVVLLFNTVYQQPMETTPAVVERPDPGPVKAAEESSAPEGVVKAVEVQKEITKPEGEQPKEIQVAQAMLVKEEIRTKGVIAETSSQGLSVEPVEKAVLSHSDAREAIASVAGELDAGFEVTDAEIDALLAEAMAEVKREKSAVKTAPIAAEDLLEEVESELEHSFRQKVLDLLKEGYKKTKTAVANTID